MLTKQYKINSIAQDYLDSTDWYIIREIETGKPCPQEIKDERAKARLRIIEEKE